MEKKVIILFYPLMDSVEVFPNLPWALLYLERMVRFPEVEVILIDERLNPDYSDILKNNASRLLFSGVSSMVGYQITQGLKFTSDVRKYSEAPVIWGGWFPTVFPEILLKEGLADYVCIGQGELPFAEFTKCLIKGIPADNIPGIGTIISGKITLNPINKLTNPDFFPAVNFDLIDLNRLIEESSIKHQKVRSIDYMGSIGCPNDCKFCNMVSIYKKGWFAKKTSDIIEDITVLKNKTDISNIDFFDDNLMANKKFVLDLSKKMIEANLNLTWSAYAHIGYFLKNFSEEDIKLIYSAGCRELRIGAESGDQQVLDLIGKKTNLNKNLEIVRVLKSHHIHIRYLTMVCLPFNPERDFWRTISMIGRATIIYPEIDVHVRFFVPFPGTELYPFSIKKGFIPPATINELILFFEDNLLRIFRAPWYNKDYHRYLKDFVNFYFVFADSKVYKKFTPRSKPFVFIINKLLFPVIWVRFRFRIMMWRFEPVIFGNLLKHKIK